VKLVSKSNTSLTYTWEAPETVSGKLENRYLVLLSKCTVDTTKVNCRTKKAEEISETQTTWSVEGLIPNGEYHFIVCSSNDVFMNNTIYRKPQESESCHDEHFETDGRK